MCYNSDSDDSAKFQVFDFISSKVPYSPVLQELLRKGNAECLYQLNLNGISDSNSNSNSDTSSVPLQRCVQRDRCLKRINVDDSPSSKDEYATEWYSESPGRQ